MRKNLLLSLTVALLLSACASAPQGPVKLTILAINDFHGNLMPPQGGIRVKDPADPRPTGFKTVTVPAGGAEYLATAVAQLRAANPNHVFVAAGDLIGASPLLSALFHDEPTVEAMGLMGLEISSVGNHEFDKGSAELLRMQHGGCNPVDGCKGPSGSFKGASYTYLAASTIDTNTGKTLLPAYTVRRFEGVPVAFIGLTLKGTPDMVVPAGVAGLQFRDEAETVNELVPQLQAQGIEAIVVLIHEGGVPVGDYNDCPGISGAIVDIVKHFDKAVDIVISGHTHRAYNCRIDGRLVTSGDKYGTIVTSIGLLLDRRTHDVISAVADNHLVRHDTYARDPAQTALIAGYAKLAVPLAKRVVGTLGASLPKTTNPAGESPLGQVIADAQLAATRKASEGGAQIAFMNAGGIRTALLRPDDGQLRYEQLFAVQPFYNNLVTMTLSGAQIVRVLEQQWKNPAYSRIMEVSKGFAYTWDASRPPGARVVPGSVMIDGEPVEPGTAYRVTVNSFMASGGDGYTVFNQGTGRVTGGMDVDALEAYVAAHPNLQPDSQERVSRKE
ncbi:MAG: bifunctional metallophosphatase/5'-nucleotidase [Pseudomonadota bacterium]|nr:bifunctional metallophosphatase/5'-nucleotidase [Pseudomonadota bacterium]